MPISIRAAERADIPFLVECNAAMASETEHKMLDRDVLTRGTQAVFDDPRRGFYLVAELEGERAGCLLITYEWSDWRNRMVWWIQSVYVVPEGRRRGVMRALYDVAKREAQAAGAGGLRLYVDTSNARAQAVYAALGMNGDHYRVFEEMFR